MTPSFKLTWRDLRAGDRAVGDGVAVVLARDLDRAGLEPLHRVVAAVVTEAQLVGLAAERRREQLVAEADPEDRHLDRGAPELRGQVAEGGRVAGPFDRKTPSGRRASTSLAGVVAGTTSTSAIRLRFAGSSS